MNARRAAVALLGLALACASCRRDERPAPSPSPTASAGAADGPPMMLSRGVRFVRAGAGDAADAVKRELAGARNENRRVLVYVGATWCEPCRRMHEAASHGDLDATFPDLTLVEFDLDEDRARLASAGYASQYIPMFAKPTPEGRASGRYIEGAVKGTGAVAQLTPRLRTLLDE